MRRRKPQSGKAKREQLQAKRATRRDDGGGSEAGVPTASMSKTASTSGKPGNSIIAQRHAKGRTPATLLLEDQRRSEARRSARAALESRFIRLSPAYVEHYRSVLAKRPFTRPVDAGAACLDESALVAATDGTENDLTCPKRPKWKFYMTKKEVEKNESVMFDKWLPDLEKRLQAAEQRAEFQVMGYFERNLDVWRQLWRVSEISDILLVLLDVRCPLLHFPISLQDYVTTLRPRKRCILILTKVDLVPSRLADVWKSYLEQRFEMAVVMVESYKEHTKGVNTQGTRSRFDVGASLNVRKALVATLQDVHTSLCTPPSGLKSETKARWRPRVRENITWSALVTVPEEEALRRNESKRHVATRVQNMAVDEELDGGMMAGGKAEAKKLRRMQRAQAMSEKAKSQATTSNAEKVHGDSQAEEQEEQEEEEAKVKDDETSSGDLDDAVPQEQPPYLSIGLIGQPNVGKSSLLNALLGKKVVRASRTPGKTKSLQTIYWSSEVRLVDCPGLVFPSFVGMEKQVMAGVIPIQNVESVVHELGQRMPMEKILDLQMPEELIDDASGEQWSTDTLLATFALDRGFLTAKAARPDVYRAGSMLLRAFHSSQIAWGFRPHIDRIQGVEQEGLWLPDFQAGPAREIGNNVAGEAQHTDVEGITTVTEGEDDENDGISEGEFKEDDTDEDSEAFEDEDQDEGDTLAKPAQSKPQLGTSSAFGLLALDQSDEEEEAEA